MHLQFPLRELFPSWLAIGALPEPLEGAFAEECRARFDIHGKIIFTAVILCTFLWWPLDWVVFSKFPGVSAGMIRCRVVVAAMSALYLFLPRTRLVARHIVVLFAAAACACSGMAGFSAGAFGGPDAPYFHALYVTVFVTVPMPVALRARFLLTGLIAGALLACFMLPYPGYIDSPFTPLCVSFLGFTVLLSTWFGHNQFYLSRENFVQARELSEHGRLLESRVEERTDELRRLLDSVETARDDERTRISRELHDELGQELSALRYSLSFTKARYRSDPGAIFANLEDLEDLLRRTAQTTRSLVTDLRPRVLDDLGLGAAVEWMVQRIEQRGDLACKLAVSGDLEAIDGRVVNAAFRVLQEALTNVVRHARAAQVEVTITAHDHAIELRVADDGVGIGASRRGREEASSGVGLLGMRERVHALGGEITICDRRPQRGTEVRCRIPVSPLSKKPASIRGGIA